jgi:hypothetical protein
MQRFRASWVTAIVLLQLIGCRSRTPNAGAGMPSPESLFEAYADLVGAREAEKTNVSAILVGRVELPDLGKGGTIDIAERAPNQLLVHMSINGLGEFFEGFDGEKAWSVVPKKPPRLKSEEEIADLKHSADFFGLLHYREHYPKLQTLGKTVFEGETVYEVQGTTPEGSMHRIYFSTELPFKVGLAKSVFVPGKGKLPWRVHLGEYRHFDNVMLPTTLVEQGVVHTRIVIDDVAINPVKFPAIRVPAELVGL